MNAGRSYSKALEQAKANAQRTGTNRYMWQFSGVYWLERDPPNGAFGSHPYTEVHPDGSYEDKATDNKRETMATVPDKFSGWSVVYREVDGDESSPFQQMGQGLYKTEAVALGKLLFERDRLGHVEILDHTATTRGYYNPRRPAGVLED